jgi:hypothetical protein
MKITPDIAEEQVTTGPGMKLSWLLAQSGRALDGDNRLLASGIRPAPVRRRLGA